MSDLTILQGLWMGVHGGAQVVVPQQPPVRPLGGYGGGGGGGGGGYYPEKGLRRKHVFAMSGSSWVVKDVVKKASLGLLSQKKMAAPAIIPEEISREEIQRGIIRGLRGRITTLEERIRALKVSGQYQADARIRAELDVALRTVDELREIVAALAAKLDQALQAPPVEVRVPVFLSAPPAPETPSSTPLWAAGALFLLAECLPDRGSRAKDALRSTAGAIALAWGLKWLDSL